MINKVKYIVADPLYVLPLCMSEECLGLLVDNKIETKQICIQAINKALMKYTGNKAWASFTNFDGYNNVMLGNNIIKPDFDTTTGLICVCRLTDSIKNRWRTEYQTTKMNGAAIFKMSEDIDVEFQGYSNWTVIEIKDIAAGKRISSLPYESACFALGLPFKPKG